MILKAKPAYRSGWAGAVAAVGLALCLPFGVARSDEPQDNPPPPPPERPNDTPPPTRPREVRGFEIDRDGRRVVEGHALARTAQSRGDGNSDELERLREEMQKAQEQMAQAQQRMERLHRRMEELGVKSHGPNVSTAQPRSGGGFGGGGASGDWRRSDGEAERELLKLKIEEKQLRELYGDEHPAVKNNSKRQKALQEQIEKRGAAGEDRRERGEGSRGGPPPTPRPHVAPTPATPPPGAAAGGFGEFRGFSPFGGAASRPAQAGAGAGGDQRIDELTKAVAELKRAVDEMRRDRERDRRPPPPQP